MRFSEDKIKDAILHPIPEIRDRAIRYFGKANSPDPSLMALVIRAVETYGRTDAYQPIGAARDLRQTEESIAWVIDELNNDETARHENYPYNLAMVLLEADPALLLNWESAILEACHFPAFLRGAFAERVHMLSWDQETCWRELEAFCEEGKDKNTTSEVDLGRANRIVEALARHGAGCEEKVLALLRQKVHDFTNNPMTWMEPLVVRLAGRARLESAIPLIIAKLLQDGGDVLNNECAKALTWIGTPSVIHAVAGAVPGAGRHFRLYATEPLSCIRSDLAVETVLNLLKQENDRSNRIHLAHALLSQFAEEGITEARQLLVGREPDWESHDLRIDLLETCTLMDVRFPEYDEWQAAEKAEAEQHWKRMKELEGNPTGMVLYALEKLAGKQVAERPRSKPAAVRPAVSGRPVPTFPPRPKEERRVGRNESCPCGSGKKFKHCCMRTRTGR